MSHQTPYDEDLYEYKNTAEKGVIELENLISERNHPHRIRITEYNLKSIKKRSKTP